MPAGRQAAHILAVEQAVHVRVDLAGVKATLPWNVVIEAQGKKDVKITVTKTTPGGYATSQDFQITSMCAVIDAAR